MELEELKSLIRDVPDFPSKGIMFRDLTTLLKNGEALQVMSKALAELYRGCGVTKVVGIESRGFIGGSIMAYELGCGFVPARKPGKLPAVTVKKSYAKEYGVDMIELHSDAIQPGDVVVLHDDLLATGGTMRACYDLVKSHSRLAHIASGIPSSIRRRSRAAGSRRRVKFLAFFDDFIPILQNRTSGSSLNISEAT